MHQRPLIGLTCGDPAGVGPELVEAVRVDDDVRGAARLLILGSAGLRPRDVSAVTAEAVAAGTARESTADALWVETSEAESFEVGEVRANAGRAALAALRAAHELATADAIDALVTAPVSKTAMHLAGEEVEGQTELFTRWTGADPVQMVALAGDLRVMLLTRHLPLAQALKSIDAKSVRVHLELFDRFLRGIGFERPRLVLCGLNPHAGEGGLFGDEEQRLLTPGLEAARRAGVSAEGPLSPDAVFPRAAAGEFDGVLALYHDQAFIPVKLLAPQAGITVLAGLPYLRVSPTHGTAFDIAGKGLASPEGLRAAVLEAARWASRRLQGAAPGTDPGQGLSKRPPIGR